MRIGLAGIGFMGWIHYLAYSQTAGADVVAFCSRDETKRGGDWRSIEGNFGPPGEQIDVSGMTVHDSLDQMLAQEDIDLIDLCLPPHLHVAAIEKCLGAGKKVLCEKPLALTATDAVAIANDASPGQLLVAHILPFMNEYQFLLAAVQDERFGNLRSMRLKRFISPPDWIPDFYDREAVGGPLIDLHVHDAHLIRLLMGMPTKCHTANERQQGLPKRYETLFEFGDCRYCSSGGGVIDSPGRAFTHGFEAIFDDATLQFEFAAYTDGSTASIPLVVLPTSGSGSGDAVQHPQLGDGDPVKAFGRQMAAVQVAASGGEMHPALDPAVAADALTICEMQANNLTV